MRNISLLLFFFVFSFCSNFNDESIDYESVFLFYSNEVKVDIDFLKLNLINSFSETKNQNLNSYIIERKKYINYLEDLIKNDSPVFFKDTIKTNDAIFFINNTSLFLDSINNLNLNKEFIKRVDFLIGIKDIEVESNLYVEYLEYNFLGYSPTLVNYNILNRIRNVLIIDNLIINSFNCSTNEVQNVQRKLNDV
ncbi:MAG: hypothetical protein ACK4RM_08830 [Flavobacterium sp.]